MEPKTILYVIIAIILFNYCFGRLISWLEATRMSPVLPGELKGFYDEEKYRKQQAYKRENQRFGFLSSTLSLATILVMLLAGGFAWLDAYIRSITGNAILQALLFFGILGLASDILSTPLSWYHTFVIEEKYGFNKTTVRTFFLDKLKGYFLGAILGGGLLALLVWIWQQTGSYFWLIAWGVSAVVMIFMSMFYTTLFLPLFNKLKPIEDEELNTAIRNYSAKADFGVTNILEMDGSRRSTKANAFFSGLGPKKKIVLFDTLVKEYSTNEIVAVLAHEVGHYKRKHVISSMIIGLLQTGLTLYILSLALGRPEISAAIGAGQSFHIGLLVFGLLYSPVSMVTGILMNAWSRKNEYEADAYAATTYDGEYLISSLKKLSVDSLSNLRPHPLNVFVNYSHPPVLQRIDAIRKVKAGIRS